MPSERYNRLKAFAKEHRTNSTKAEVRLWCELFRAKKMLGYSFLRQYPIGNYIIDFYCKDLKLAIETDGITHTWEETNQKDIAKEKFLADNGIAILRFEDSQVMHDLNNVSRTIEEWIAEREQSSPCPLQRGTHYCKGR